ncbi:hypothetical protein [Bradyrhizobium sp. LB11.1]|uniref:hypothetical protein n=1 Tax=Bradyrhizobium sp. LB11.1 TaxID=3156326 RepID=UPI0033924FFE
MASARTAKRHAHGDQDFAVMGSFCRGTFAGVTELPTGFLDKSLIAMMLSAGTLIACGTCVRNDSGVSRMSGGSMSSISGGSATSSSSATGQSKSADGSQGDGSTFASLMHDGTPYDEVKVNLPNGMSVGIVHFGGGGFDSSALKSIEDFVQRMASQQTAGGTSETSTSNTDPSQNNDTPDTIGLDKIHVDLPNGLSFDVIHSSGNQASDSAAVMKELTEAAEELTESLAQYSPASMATSAYAAQQAASSDRTSQVDARS